LFLLDCQLKVEKVPLKTADRPSLPQKSLGKGSGDNLRKVLLAHVPACLPDRGQDIFRGHEALVELHLEEPANLVELHPGDPRDFFDLGAHGVGTAGSQKAALFLHAVDFKGEFGQKVFLHYSTSLRNYWHNDNLCDWY
jgi:hypothetical protein